jgi:phosphomannomutase
MKNLMISISGLRGVIGETLTPELVTKYVAAFAHLTGHGKVVLGRDSRPSGDFITHLAKGTLVASGCEVVDLGVVPTPTVQLLTEVLGADAGLVITASHNPVKWNGLKFIGSDGMFLPPEKAEQLFALADDGVYRTVPVDKLGKVVDYPNAVDEHINRILKLDYIDVDGLKKRKFKVAVDTVNGAGGVIIPRLLEKLGCEVVEMNTETTGFFSHTPEPVPENLVDLCDKVKEEKADLGIAVDPDVDRCALVDENGRPLSEEYTLTLATKFILSKKMGNVIINMSTTRAVEEIAKYYNCTLYRTPVGEIHVAKKMRELGAAIGGEGNGGVILPEIHLGRDAPVAVALTLQHLLEFGGTISGLKNSLPQYAIAKHKINIEDLDAENIFNTIKMEYGDAAVNEEDGLKLDLEDYWIHIRKSNTEPIIRIIAEARTLEEADKICFDLVRQINNL